MNPFQGFQHWLKKFETPQRVALAIIVVVIFAPVVVGIVLAVT